MVNFFLVLTSIVVIITTVQNYFEIKQYLGVAQWPQIFSTQNKLKIPQSTEKYRLNIARA